VNTRKQQCLVNLYDDGTCLMTCDGSEIGQGLHTKIIQYAAYHLSQIVPGSEVSVDRIRVGPIGTDKVSHGSITGGSTTSEGVCEAVREAICKLRENMKPFMPEELQEDPFAAAWMEKYEGQSKKSDPAWELQGSDGTWLPAPFKPSADDAAPGKIGEFTFEGVLCTIKFTSSTEGVVTSKGKAYQVRLSAKPSKSFAEKKRDGELSEEVAGLTFAKLCGKAAGGGAEMQASGCCQKEINYNIFGAACSEVEVDALTGETVILSTSMLYDCGKSLNPTIDLGQCEGGFMMGVGFFLRERLIQDSVTGKLATDGTWEYKIPCFQDVPLKFDVEFFPRAFESGIVSSKASGEPPLVLSASVFCAVKEAVMAGRKEFGQASGPFRLDAPATPRDIALAIGAATTKA